MIQRPGSREGDDDHVAPAPLQSIKNNRSGIGNYTIIRPGAKRINGTSRAVAFSRLSVIDSENAGVVELGAKTLSKLFDVQVPDNRDITWLAEKARLLAKYQATGMSKVEAEREIKVNKPLGRSQRTITKKRNIAESNLSVANKIAELKEEVDQGRVESKTAQTGMTAELVRVFRGMQSLNTLSRAEFNDLKQIASRSYIPSNYRSLGMTAAYVDKAYYDANSGNINLLFIGKLIDAERRGVDAKQYNMNLIVKDFSDAKGTGDGMPAKSIATMYSALSRTSKRQPRYLNLDDGGLISQDQLRVIAGLVSGGFSDPIFSIRKKLKPIVLSVPSSGPSAPPAAPAGPPAPPAGTTP